MMAALTVYEPKKVIQFFRVDTGVRQGCNLSPMLFILAIDYFMKKSMNRPNFGILWDSMRRFTDLDFADDLALIVEAPHILQEMTSSLEENAAKVGRKISSEKTKTMAVGQHALVNQVVTNGMHVENVEKFTYLGSVLTCRREVEADINGRNGEAGSVFGNLQTI